MTGEFRGEGELSGEALEEQKHQEFLAAEEEVGKIMEEINRIFATMPDRREAEKVVLENWGDKMDKAMKVSGEALREWLRAMEESQAKYKREMGK
ncbi:MAG: hypothetical protein WC348_00450 [Patescibacteria group bacterium]|jgi:hypothetical protein